MLAIQIVFFYFKEVILEIQKMFTVLNNSMYGHLQKYIIFSYG